MTKILRLALLILAIICLGQTQMAMTWDNWVLPNWTPSWTPAPWTKPVPQANFKRNVIGSSTNPASNNFNLRLNHYLWEHVTLGGSFQIACGPESYLNSNFYCSRNTKYWSPSSPQICAPDYYQNFIRAACSNSPPPGVECCYKPSNGDLYDYQRTSTAYPP